METRALTPPLRYRHRPAQRRIRRHGCGRYRTQRGLLGRQLVVPKQRRSRFVPRRIRKRALFQPFDIPLRCLRLCQIWRLRSWCAQVLTVPGEHIMKYLRIRCVNNVRGGNLVNVRYVQVKGMTKFNSS